MVHNLKVSNVILNLALASFIKCDLFKTFNIFAIALEIELCVLNPFSNNLISIPNG